MDPLPPKLAFGVASENASQGRPQSRKPALSRLPKLPSRLGRLDLPAPIVAPHGASSNPNEKLDESVPVFSMMDLDPNKGRKRVTEDDSDDGGSNRFKTLAGPSGPDQV